MWWSSCAQRWVHTGRCHGESLWDVVPRVPPAVLQQAQLDLLPDVLDGLVGDERNVLLTLARMVVTAESGAWLWWTSPDSAVRLTVGGRAASRSAAPTPVLDLGQFSS